MKHGLARQMTGLLRQLRLGPWLDRLDHGPDTVLAPWGQPVSAESCLRAARAILADAATADAVLQAVLERTAGRSLPWITHRPEEPAAFAVVRYHSIGPA